MKLILPQFTESPNARPSLTPLTTVRDHVQRVFSRRPFQQTDPAEDLPEQLPWKANVKSATKSVSKTAITNKTLFLSNHALQIFENIKSIGFTETMEEYTRRKLGVFNVLNFFQLITGLIVPIAGAIADNKLTPFSWYMSTLPAFVSVLVLSLNSVQKYNTARIAYFLLYPFLTSIVYMGGMNLGGELYFILYGILSVFFIQELNNMLFSVALSMISYFVLAVVVENYRYELVTENIFLYVWNQIIAIIFIFYGLYLIKKENAGYQASILAKNLALQNKNVEIRRQKKEIAEKAIILKGQAGELTDLNALKNKLFSVIAHDLKSPMYALQSLFRNMQQYDLPAEEIKGMVPEVLNDLNYTTGLMENLLQWSKTQMQTDAVRPQKLETFKMISDIVKLLRIQATVKDITIEIQAEEDVYVNGDKDMINLVLRNLLSNAIKFTPAGGNIVIGTEGYGAQLRLFVQDNGIGMSEEALQKLRENDYYTTKGTASESGTGLGLMLCKEFITKNGSTLEIKSFPKHGSMFSFMLNSAETDEELKATGS